MRVPAFRGMFVVARIILILVVFVAAPNTAIGERLPVKIYTTTDGLAHNNVGRIVRDSRGFLWFCTFEGLSRFDGYSFTTYGVDHGLPSPVVHDLLETREGEYWVATAAGLCRFNPKGTPERHAANIAEVNGTHASAANAMFEVYFPGANARSRTVTVLFEDRRGTIWCGTTSGLYRIERQNGEVIFHLVVGGTPADPDNYIWASSIIEDRGRTLWIGSGNGIHRLFSDGRVEYYPRARYGLPDASILSLLEDRDGRIWVGTQNGLCRLVPQPDPARPVVARLYTEKDGLPTNWINKTFQSSDGTLWAAGQGLIRLIPTDDGSDFRFRGYSQSHGLNHPAAQSLAEDRNGNLWLGMATGGAVKLARSGITTFEEADGLAFAKTILRNRSGDLLVAGGTRAPRTYISRFDGERFTQIRLGLPEGVAYSWGWNQLVLEDRAGEWWVATDQGLYRFPRAESFERLARARPKAVYTTRDGLAGNVIIRLFEDSRGDIWISATGEKGQGLSRWERYTGTFHHYTEKDGLPLFVDSYPTSFSEDRRGTVWVGFSYSGGIGVSGGLVRVRKNGFRRFTADNGIPEGGIFNLFVDSSGRLWVLTTRGGVCRIDNPEAEGLTSITYTTADGLSSNDVRSVTEDRWGRIYFGTARGIDRLDPATGHVKHYTTADGALPGTSEAAMAGQDGAVWFNFPTGVVRLIPEPEQQPIAPPVLITGLRIAGDAQPISAVGEIEIAPVELSTDRNQLQIDFVALGFSPGEGLRYQYMLEGTPQGWSAPSEQRTVNFANLAPGSYRFLVRAVNADGVMSDMPANFGFTILTPIWQRSWFIAIATVLIVLTVYSIYRYRLRQTLGLERMRTRIASDLHDDIGANLTKITILSEVANRQIAADARPDNSALASIANISRESVASMRDIVWAINPKRDKLLDLTRRMRGFASDIFTSRDIEFQFRAPDRDADLKLTPESRRDVFLIFKEAVNNIVRHSDCLRSDIEMRVENGWLVLEVSDYGKGFDVTEVGEGQGLSGMRRRAETLGGSLEIVSREEGGTTIRLNVPVVRRRIYERARGRAKNSGNGKGLLG